ncbi:hypothetical protein K9M47_03720 [Candidatus Gracilibacteria bacterium]|nr:hypothetical protein [Candidatus Gracilibacteria bacterium]MCF7898523.1 hypothetical protein [Candidatus Paceibacterota bacterium]
MNRRLLFAIIAVTVFALGVIVWFFIYAQQKPATSLGETRNPLLPSGISKGFQFIFGEEEPPISTSSTEMTFPTPEALTKIWDKPATGQTFITKSVVIEVDATSTKGTTTVMIKKLANSTSTILMFVDRITGYVYAYNRELGKIYQISNTTIPGIHDAYIFNNGKSIILRYADNDRKAIVGILANIPNVTDKGDAKPLEDTTYLPAQVTSVAINKKGTLASYLVTGDAGTSVYTVSQKGALLVAGTPFKEWSLSYGGDTLYATTKPSAYIEGQTVVIPSFEFVVGNKTGLMSNPSETGMFINSMWSSTGLKTFLSDSGNQAVLSVNTLASKCGWGQKDFLVCAVPRVLPRKTEGLPDDWFQGRFTFDDSLEIIDTKTANSYPLYSFSSSQKLKFDVTNFSISENNSLISFNRKQDASLWLLDTSLINNE